MAKTKRRRNHTGNIRRHGNHYEVSISVNGDRRYFYADTKQHAEAIIRTVIQSSPSESVIENLKTTTVTVEDFCTEYLTNLDEKNPNSLYDKERLLHLYILPYFYHRMIATITTPDVQNFIEDLRIEGLGPKTIKNITAALSAIMRDAIRHGFFKVNPVMGAKLPAVRNINKTDQIMDANYYYFLRLLEIETPKYADAFYIDLLTGMRRSELMGLTWDKVNFEQHTITVDCQLKIDKLWHQGHYIGATKTHFPRTFILSKQACDRLQRIKTRQDLQIAAGDYKNDRGFVFVNEQGHHLSETQLHTAYIRFRKSHPELPQNMRFHDLRGSCATHALAIGTSLKAVSHQLGHRNTAFTLDRYGRVTFQMQESAASKLEQDIARFDGLNSKQAISDRFMQLIKAQRRLNDDEN